MKPTYSILLYDHEERDWSGELAREMINGPNTQLVRDQLKNALRTLRDGGWDNPSMYIEREDEAS